MQTDKRIAKLSECGENFFYELIDHSYNPDSINASMRDFDAIKRIMNLAEEIEKLVASRRLNIWLYVYGEKPKGYAKPFLGVSWGHLYPDINMEKQNGDWLEIPITSETVKRLGRLYGDRPYIIETCRYMGGSDMPAWECSLCGYDENTCNAVYCGGCGRKFWKSE